MVRQDMQDMLHRCQLCVQIWGGYEEDVVDQDTNHYQSKSS